MIFNRLYSVKLHLEANQCKRQNETKNIHSQLNSIGKLMRSNLKFNKKNMSFKQT